MKEFWQKTAVILLFVAMAAAVSVGQKGKNISGEGGSKSKAKLIKEQENAEGGKGQAGAKKDEGGKGQESAKDRVMREGKLVRGWAVPPCIVIDPGHGGYDPGKIGAGGLKEKDVNLSIAKLLRENLEAAGVRVILTREDDVSLCEE
ncbi:MAG: N-acetylmuramoyl-L-alanine amidase, partial [Lachnospiraceae bacterium]|nr:N-acetylmuramoyl-L-alanine amidase [Lachnospiraceae bacterium]